MLDFADKSREVQMQKAHLYEAIFLVNQGVDQTVRGLARLKKAAGIAGEIYGDTLATLEHTRAQVNVQFPGGNATSRKARCRTL
jgi:hypothetical protein